MKLARLLVLLLLLPAPAVAQDTPVHQDFRRVFPDDASVFEAGQRVLDYTEFAIGDGIEVRDQRLRLYSVLLGGFGNEDQWLALARQDAAGMRQAMERSSDEYPIPPLLIELEPPCRRLGNLVATILSSLDRVSQEDRPILERVLDVRHVERSARDALSLLDQFDGFGYDTERLRYLLGLIISATSRINIDPALLAPAGSAGAGGSGGSANILVQPNPAYFGQEIRVLVVDPEHRGAAVTLEAFGQQVPGRLDSAGIGLVYMTIPWSARVGVQSLSLSWGDGGATVDVDVIKVPTQWRGIRAFVNQDETLVSATLMDVEGRPVGPASVAWSAAGGTLTGTGNVSSEGSLAFAVGGVATNGTVTYFGNRTHAADSIDWDISRGLADLGIGAGPPPADSPSGSSGSYTEWGLPSTQLIILWLALLLVLVLAGLAASEVRNRRVASWSAPETVAQPDSATQETPAQDEPQLAPDHPLLRVLERAGFQPHSLTLREAEPLWQALGAPPRLATWLHRYESAYYRQLTPPEIPAEVLAWARRT